MPIKPWLAALVRIDRDHESIAISLNPQTLLGEPNLTKPQWRSELLCNHNFSPIEGRSSFHIVEARSAGRLLPARVFDILKVYKNELHYTFIVSVQGLFKAPWLYDEDADLPLGNGQIDVEGRALLGKSLGKLGYFGIEAGYRFRAEDPVDEFRYLVEYGFDLSDNIYLRTKLDGTLGLGDVEDFVDSANVANPSLPLVFDLGKLEYTAGYKINRVWSLEVTGTTNIYGNNTLRGTNVQFTIVGQF